MGVDFANYQIFGGDVYAEETYSNLLSQIPELIIENGFKTTTQEEESDRSIVVGPPGRWIWVYDSYARGINPTNHDVEQLAIALSGYGAVVNIAMYDTAIVHFFLYQHEYLVDRFVSAPWFYLGYIKKWQSHARFEESDFYGQPEKWAEFLTYSTDLNKLREAWQQKLPEDILRQTALVFGWDPILCQGGYIVSDDGYYDFRYDEYFEFKRMEVDFSAIQVYYFNEE